MRGERQPRPRAVYARGARVVVAQLSEERRRCAAVAAVRVEQQVDTLKRVTLLEEAAAAFDELGPSRRVLLLGDQACAVRETRQVGVAVRKRLESAERARVQPRLQIVGPALHTALKSELGGTDLFLLLARLARRWRRRRRRRPRVVPTASRRLTPCREPATAAARRRAVVVVALVIVLALVLVLVLVVSILVRVTAALAEQRRAHHLHERMRRALLLHNLLHGAAPHERVDGGRRNVRARVDFCRFVEAAKAVGRIAQNQPRRQLCAAPARAVQDLGVGLLVLIQRVAGLVDVLRMARVVLHVPEVRPRPIGERPDLQGDDLLRHPQRTDDVLLS